MPLLISLAGEEFMKNNIHPVTNFGSHMRIELWRSKKDKYVVFLYDDMPVPIYLCSDKTMCPLQEFLELLNDVKVPNLQEMCMSSTFSEFWSMGADYRESCDFEG